MNWRKHVGLLFGFMVTIGLVFLISHNDAEAADKPILIKWSESGSQNSPRCRTQKWWADEFEKRTGNRVKIQIYWSGSLAKTKDQFDAAKSGLADMATNPGSVWHPEIWPVFQLFELLFVDDHKDWYAHMKAFKEMYETTSEVKNELDRSGAKLLFNLVGHPGMFGSLHPLVTLQDFKGKKIRGIGDVAVWVGSLGAATVSMPSYEIYEAMKKGTCEVTQFYIYQSIPAKYCELVKYVNLTGITWINCSTWMNLKTWNSLPPDIQKIATDLWDDVIKQMAAIMDKDWNDSITALRDKYGVKIIEPTPENYNAWANSAKFVQDNWVKKMGAMNVDGNKLIANYLKLYNKNKRPQFK